jgi:hypothetical protein
LFINVTGIVFTCIDFLLKCPMSANMASAPGYHYKDGNRHIFRLPHIFKYEQKEIEKKTCNSNL